MAIVMLGLFLILLADVFSAQAPANCPRRRNNHEVVFSWDSSNIQFNWPNETFRRAHSGKRVVPIGIKVFGDKVFMNIPRWYGNGHPANVVYASRPQRGDKSQPMAIAQLHEGCNLSLHLSKYLIK